MKHIPKWLIWLLSLTWGLPMTLIGAAAALFLYWRAYVPTRIGPCWMFVVGEGWGGVNLGPVVLVSKTVKNYTIYHEIGHCLQNCVWGPLFPFVIAIPSAIRYWYREWKTPTTRYDDIWFEGQATRWGVEFMSNEDNNNE